MIHNRKYSDPGGGTNQYDIEFPSQPNKRYKPNSVSGLNITEVNKSIADFSIFDINNTLTKLHPNWKFISINREKTLLIFSVLSERTAKSIIEVNSININNVDVAAKFIWHPTLNTIKGIIYCREIIGFSNEFLVENLASQNVTEVYRMTRREGINVIPTGLFIITFNAKSIPRSIKIAFLNVNVETYFPNPMQCLHCLKLGHTKRGCKKIDENPACTKCGSHEEHTECSNFCINCHGDHPSKYKKCEKFLAEKEIIKIKTNKNISFPEARKIFEKLVAYQHMQRQLKKVNYTLLSTN